MKFYIFSHEVAREFEPDEPTIAIRIFCPGARKTYDPKLIDPWANCPEAPFDKSKYVAVHEYSFKDVEVGVRGWEDRDDLADLLVFTPEIAESILLDFKRSYRPGFSVMAHCYAGASRSVAVAVALNEIFGLDAEWYTYSPPWRTKALRSKKGEAHKACRDDLERRL